MARASKAVKASNHKKIIEIAARQIRNHGIEGLNVSETMKQAGLTHGGFYRHFESKNHLVHQAIETAFAKFAQQLRDDLDTYTPEQALDRFLARYLSMEHVDNPEVGCPTAALGTEIARSDNQTKAVFSKGVTQIIDLLDQALKGRKSPSGVDGRALMTTLTGTITLARGTNDEAQRSAYLTNARKLLAS